jgi:RNA polymerase sigma-70 factor (ECF subfamily)
VNLSRKRREKRPHRLEPIDPPLLGGIEVGPAPSDQSHPTSQAPPLSRDCVTDDDLVERARQGDPAAFGELVDRHRRAVYRAALAVLGSHADAEDAAQDALIAAFRRLDTFRGRSSFKTWLLAIAWNEAINRRRSLKAMWKRIVQSLDRKDDGEAGPPSRRFGEAGGWTSLDANAQTPEQQLAGGELRRHVRAAILGLPPKLRDALLLAQSGDYTYEEIAAIVNAPVGTIKWRVSEARRVVKARLRDRGYADV